MAYRLISNLTEFSDDILLCIFSYLSSWDLLNVVGTCQRFNKIGKDHSLWKRADFSEGQVTAAQVSRHILPCLQLCTKHLNLKGHKREPRSQSKWKTNLLTPTVLKNIGNKCPNLLELFLNEAIVDARKLKLINLGEVKELQVLSIIDCEFVHLPSPITEGSYFKNMHNIFPKLETLEISKCNWINDYDLMVLSKLDSLKKLILKSDLRIGFTIAYLSISYRFGFKNLEELDLRGTSLQNSDVQSIVQSGKLKSLCIGPIGRVKRLNDESDDGLNLVMSDPHRREEPRQQVVVINMGPNGVHWKEANDEELDKMGLQWVKNGLNRIKQNEKEEDEEQHYFFGKEGKIVKSGECSQASTANNSSKRNLDEDDDDDSEDDSEAPPRKKAVMENKFENLEEEELVQLPMEKEESSPESEENNLPDDGLSDSMVHAFKDHAKELRSLVLGGCGITNAGLFELISYIPSLTYLDVSNTHVTSIGLQEARLLLPECKFVSCVHSER